MIQHNNLALGRATRREAKPRARQGWHYAAQLLVAISCLHAYGQTSPWEHFTLPGGQPSAGRSGDWDAWRASMSRVPLPKNGCFKASYPSTDWREVPCATPPSYPLGRTGVGGNDSETVGGGSDDYAAWVPGFIVTAEGSFISVTPGISEAGNIYDLSCSLIKPNIANAFELQLNSNTFPVSPTSVCNGPIQNWVKCGWQQFIFQNNFDNNGNPSATAIADIQYWLENYGPTGTACPGAKWLPYPSPSNSNEVDCYTNNGNGMVIPSQTMADLSQITMMATADSGGTDTLIMQTAGGDLTALGQDSLLKLAQHWHAAEFNIFGDGCGSQANFSSGSTIVVKTSVVDSSLDTPKCLMKSFTGETNNLTLGSCYPFGGDPPAIEFTESNVVHNNWSSGAPAPTAVYGPATAVLEGQIYLVGGCSPGGRAVVGDTQIYDPATNTWSTGVPLPTPICAAAAAVVDNVLYIIGGGSDTGGLLSYTNSVWAYSPKTRAWSGKTAMPIARDSAAVAVANNTIYVIGGWNGSTMSTVESYNPASDTWTEDTPLLVSKAATSAGLIGTTIVAAAGLNPNPTATGDNEGYNVSSDAWTSLQADPTARGGACGGVIGTQLYVAGGYNNGPAVAVTESFNLSRNFWKALAPMPQATSWGGSAVYGGKLYCFGSTDGYNGPLLLQIYQP